MLRREQVIGVVSTWDIRKGKGGFSLLFFAGDESEGYSLLITDLRIVGSFRAEYPDDFCAYLGPDSPSDPELQHRAEAEALKIIAKKDFEIPKDKLVKLLYEPPTTYLGGRLLLIEAGHRVELKVTLLSPFNPGVIATTDTLVRSLVAFAPGRVFNERTGEPVKAP